MAWPPIPLRDRLPALRSWLRIGAAAWNPSPELDRMTVDRWFRELDVPHSLRRLSLDQLVIGLLNEKPDRVSAFTFAQALHFIGRRALAGNIRAGDAVWPRVSLHELFVAPAERYLRERGARIVTGTQLVDVELDAGPDGERLTGLRLADGQRIDCDAAILTLPPWSLTTLL